MVSRNLGDRSPFNYGIRSGLKTLLTVLAFPLVNASLQTSLIKTFFLMLTLFYSSRICLLYYSYQFISKSWKHIFFSSHLSPWSLFSALVHTHTHSLILKTTLRVALRLADSHFSNQNPHLFASSGPTFFSILHTNTWLVFCKGY